MPKIGKMFACLLSFCLIIFYTGCKKDKLDSKYASQLQHKWTVKSTSNRTLMAASTFVTSWTTTELPPIFTREFKKDGKYEYKQNGEWMYINNAPILADYELKDDSVLLLKPPPRSMMFETHRDTFIIRDISDTHLILYNRVFHGNAPFTSTTEYITHLLR